MSEIKVDTLTGKTSAGNITVTSEGGAATMQLQQGLAKAWINFDGNPPYTKTSFNVSSTVDNAAGNFTINWSNTFSTSEYSNAGGAGGNTGTISTSMTSIRGYSWTTSLLKIGVLYSGGATDYNTITTNIQGDLA